VTPASVGMRGRSGNGCETWAGRQKMGWSVRFLICDYDESFLSRSSVSSLAKVRVIRTVLQPPVANCYTEHWVV